MMKIEFKDVSVKFKSKKEPEKVVINDLNASFEAHKIHIILGKSGCGKTTFLKTMFSGVKYSGEIFVDGKNIEDLKVKDRNLAYVSQQYILYPSMSIFENIAFPLKMMGTNIDEIKYRVYQIAKELDIEMCLSRKPKHISGGQQQRVALARALIKNPNVCLMDEPLSNLDVETAKEARELIVSSLRKRKITTLYVTHNINEATSIGDFIHVIDEGKIVYSGTPQEFIKSKNKVVKQIFG